MAQCLLGSISQLCEDNGMKRPRGKQGDQSEATWWIGQEMRAVGLGRHSGNGNSVKT